MATPKKTAAPRKPSAVSDFKKKSGGVMELPSGASMKVRNPGGMRIFLDKGLVPNSLMSIIDDALKSGAAPDMSQLVNDEGKMDEQMMNDMLDLMDKATMLVAVEPQVHDVPENEDDRDDDLLYVDEIDPEDKMFIFQWVTGGTRDVEQFRNELAAGVDDLPGGKALARPAK